MANIDAYSAAESWIKLNLKEDPNQQLPKHGCYMAHVKCMLNQNILTIPNYDFGKIVKCLFRNVRSSGPRGSNSNYYSGITGAMETPHHGNASPRKCLKNRF